ncbi:MAG TPA: hypothetical protein VGO64_09875, partial [Candidatus Limnocylindrales bacterium]|nr:hypothetical protein [Candidatus Limnocylindrales bacterium]
MSVRFEPVSGVPVRARLTAHEESPRHMAVAYEPSDPDALLGLAEVAAVAGITRATARAWCFSGRLPS